MSDITVDPRDAFEKVFPPPKHVIRCGKGYACTEYNAWDAQGFIKKWEGWNACRSAMLQGAAGNSPAHYDLRPEQKNSSPAQNPIDHGYRLDCDCSGCRSLAAICSALNGNSPAIPDGYALVPVDMAPEMMLAVQLNSELGAYAAANLSGAYSLFREFWDVAVAAVPHQEVKDPAGETISEPYEFNSMSQKFHYDRTFSFASAQQWVSCNERMPDAARNIAMYGWRIGSDGEPYYGPAVDEGYLALNGKFYAYDWDQPGSIGDIHAGIEFSATHWMYWELPEAPQQEGE